MLQQLVVQRGDGTGRLVRQVPCHPLDERVELTTVVAGLGHPVGVEEQLVAVGERQHLKVRGLAGEGTQPERRSRMRRFDSPDVAAPHQQRRGVSTVDYLHALAPGVPGDDGGDEVVGTQVPREAPLDPADDIQKVRLVIGGFTEDTEHQSGGAHRGQPLAPHITDDQPDPVRGGNEGVEVPADTGLRRGGAVADSHLELTDSGRHGPEKGVLGGFGDRADGLQHPFATPAQRAGQAAREGDGDQCGQHDCLLTPRRTATDAEHRAQRHGDEADTEDSPGLLVAAASVGPTASSGNQVAPVPLRRARSATAKTISAGAPARSAAVRGWSSCVAPAARAAPGPSSGLAGVPEPAVRFLSFQIRGRSR